MGVLKMEARQSSLARELYDDWPELGGPDLLPQYLFHLMR